MFIICMDAKPSPEWFDNTEYIHTGIQFTDENLTLTPNTSFDMSIRFLFFDLGNVLVRFSNDRLLEQVATLVARTPQEVAKLLFVPEMVQKAECGIISEDEYFQNIVDQLGFVPNRIALNRAVNDIFWLNEPMVSITSRLHDSRFPCGILSNTGPWHWNYCTTTFPTILQYLPANHIVSFRVGAMKPNAAIYQAAFDLAQKAVVGISPSEVLFIDDLEKNVEGAKRFGFESIHYFPDSHDSLVEQLNHYGVV